MAYILDGAFCAVIILCICISAKKGFIKASRNILALILTAVLMVSMQPVILSYLQSSSLGDNIKTVVAKNITKTYEKEGLAEDTDTSDTEASLAICDKLGLPDFLSVNIEKSIKGMAEVKNNVFEVITDAMTLTILKIIALILLFILVRIFVFLILKLLESLFGLPGLRTINRTMGACIGIINALLAVYIICGAVALLTPVDKLAAIQEAVGSTYILKYFYENNVLLSLFI
ncbi:MAG: CvpA family protein [Clostridiales bacterium]|nr:CvpA family protein [Clostridiales bacterium]